MVSSCKEKEIGMSKYYVVGLTSREVVSGIGVKMLSCSNEMLTDILQKQKGNVLIYSKETGGEYYSVEYIHESIYPHISNFCALNAIEVIEENDIPIDAKIVLKPE